MQDTDLFRDFGIPAPQTSFCALYIDYGDGPVYFGMYTLLEVVFDALLDEQFSNGSGNCYKPEGSGATFAKGTFNETDFTKKTNTELGDWSDIISIFDALHSDTRTSNPEVWKQQLESVFDVDGFLKWMAVNTTIQNWDTYGRMNHNFIMTRQITL